MSNEAIVPSSLEIYLLGTFRVAVDGVLVEQRAWPRQKPKLLLKTLALQPLHRLHQEQLMELLWPEQDSETAVRNLYRTIHIARRVLEPQFGSGDKSHFILTDSQQVLLRAPKKLWIDVDAFEGSRRIAKRNFSLMSLMTVSSHRLPRQLSKGLRLKGDKNKEDENDELKRN